MQPSGGPHQSRIIKYKSTCGLSVQIIIWSIMSLCCRVFFSSCGRLPAGCRLDLEAPESASNSWLVLELWRMEWRKLHTQVIFGASFTSFGAVKLPQNWVYFLLKAHESFHDSVHELWNVLCVCERRPPSLNYLNQTAGNTVTTAAGPPLTVDQDTN